MASVIPTWQTSPRQPSTSPTARCRGAAPAGGAEFASVGNTVYFTEAEATLSDDARQILTRQAAWLVQNATAMAMVEGHADEPGTREFNLALGARRATSVREYLVAKGVDAGRIQTVSFGKERPASICASAGRSHNAPSPRLSGEQPALPGW